MDTGDTRIALGILGLLLWLPYLSTADVIYRPVDLFSINCGSSTSLFTPDGRNWTADVIFLSQNMDSVSAPALKPSTQQGPYTYARLSHSQFTYSFSVTSGPKFLRLFFHSTSYQNFDRSKACFSVRAGPYTLLGDFNASVNADANTDDIFFREYCIYLRDGERLNITFIPSKTAQHPDSYAFINGIEIVSMPPYLYYTNPKIDDTDMPQLVGGATYPIGSYSALETKYRLNVGESTIPPSGDTGMLRTWISDEKYLTSEDVPSTDFEGRTILNFNKTPNYTAPDIVYRTLRNMGSDGSRNRRFNLTWQFPVDSGFFYLLRLHFCQLDPLVNKIGDQTFYIFIQDLLAEDWADVLSWTDNQKGVPVVKDYAIPITANQERANISLKMHPLDRSPMKDAFLNGIELFKINDTRSNLAGPNPEPPLQTPKVPLEDSKKKSNSKTKRTLAGIAGAISGVVLISFIVALYLMKRKKGSKKKEGTSQSLPTKLCRQFSIAEIKAATNNLDEHLVVGVGGFGNVYKGYIDNGSTRVAIKRLKPGSEQGAHEFKNEIEMLSQLRHVHLVSLIGYCYESNEMMLVYDFMDHGTLSDHLYDTDNPSLSWKQRLQICTGAARGLHYLHTGAKHMIIHRDIKSTNILLDEKWIAKVSDFGLSRIGPTGSSMTHVSTQVKGSVGYVDPEYYKRQRLTEKSDVYSFGVVLLEVLSGRPPLLRAVETQKMSLVNWAKHCYEKGTLNEIVDPSLKDQIAPQSLRKFGELAISCLLEDGTQRPSINDVVALLHFALQLQDTAVKGDSHDIFGISQTTLQLWDYSNSTSNEDPSYGSKESQTLIPDNLFSEIKDPKPR
ncbi:hypothetical protein VNO78_14914 [Psophocarpus tetragonolobus]|uniref:Protein kinase domain-containing protein n=1 Tax=Psophocarpus tetragonolobus TaxID=3891 RepID=A0AAN9SDY2_PSOTE